MNPVSEAALRRVLSEPGEGRSYAGVGSRQTPLAVCSEMTLVAAFLAGLGYQLRSGAAPRADKSWEAGAARAQIFLPWRGFEEHPSGLYSPPAVAFEIAARHHPEWATLTSGERKLMARNSQQVLGPGCDDPSDFVMCWTRDRATTATSRGTGGTGQAIRVACSYGIPVFNLADPETRRIVLELCGARTTVQGLLFNAA